MAASAQRGGTHAAPSRRAVAAAALLALLACCAPLRVAGRRETPAERAITPRPGKGVFKTAANLTKVLLTDPAALCNDNSPGAFFFAPATNVRDAGTWLIYLQGGTWCWDVESCAQRQATQPSTTSSHGWPNEIFLEGMFDTDERRSPWSGANKVYVGYCSSDAWVGNVGFNDNAVGWSFRGQAIVQATLNTLLANYSLATPPVGNPRVLLAGCSAGARGAMANLDYVATMLPTGVQLRGFFDSGYWVDVAPLESSTVPLINQTQSALVLLNATARLGPLCSVSYGGVEAWKCLFGQWRLPTVKTQWLSSDSQFDAWQLPYDAGAMPPYAGVDASYANLFQRNMRGQLMQLPGLQQGGSAVFSSACFKHCTSNTDAFWGVRVDGSISLRDLLGDWYFGGPLGNRPQVIEACVGFGCGQCHSAIAKPAPPLPPARLGLYAPPPAPSPPPSLEARLHSSSATPAVQQQQHGAAPPAKKRASFLSGTHIGMMALLALVVAVILQTVAARAARRVGDSASPGFNAAREASPLLQPRPGFTALPAGIRVTKVAPVTRPSA